MYSLRGDIKELWTKKLACAALTSPAMMRIGGEVT